jgi:chitin synthase
MPEDPYYNLPNTPYIPNSPYGSRASVVSIDTSWRRRQRQAAKRGITRKVTLIKGHFIAEYPVPTAVKNAIEPVYAATSTTEFS